MKTLRLAFPFCSKSGCICVLVLTLALCGSIHAAEVKATWQPVTQNVTGATDTISHYLLYLGRTPRPSMVTHPGDGTFNYEKVLNAGRNTQHIVTGLEPGTWFFSVVAVDMDGNISDYSQQVKLELPDKTGKVPPPIIKKQTSTKSVPIKKPDSGCATNDRDSATKGLFPALFVFVLILTKKKNRTITSY